MVTQKRRRGLTFKAVADDTRREILDALLESPLPVNEIAARFRVSRPAISRHIRILRQAKFISSKRVGRERWCYLNPDPLADIEEWVSHYRAAWRVRLRSLKAHIEARDDG